jgi:nitrite reductase (NADH) small subunit
VLLANLDGAVRATGASCPHADGPLGDGFLDGQEVVCPWHGWRFDVTTGDCTRPAAQARIPTYPVRIEDGTVWVAV